MDTSALLRMAKALYSCASFESLSKNGHLISNITTADTASVDDPYEISFSKGEILDVVDNTGRWWQAQKEDGTLGSTLYPYLPSHRF